MPEYVDPHQEWMSPQDIADELKISLRSAIRVAERLEGVIDVLDGVTDFLRKKKRQRKPYRTLRVPRASFMRFLHGQRLR